MSKQTHKDSNNRPQNADDDEPKIRIRSPKTELAALIQRRGGLLNEHDWRFISEGLELRGIELSEFVEFVRPHLENTKTVNPVGMVKSKLKSYYPMTRPACSSADIERSRESSTKEKCPICHEMKGKGTRIDNSRIIPCECASEEWRQKVEQQEHDRLRRGT
jgi:hypothetical protein